MTYKSALEIIREHCDPEGKTFHSHSRAPFDHEQPVIDAAKEAMKGKSFMKPRKTPARLHVPMWLYENCENIVTRVGYVEVLYESMRFVKQPLRVSVTKEFFDNLVADKYVGGCYTFYVNSNVKDIIQEEEEGLVGKRWVRLMNTLFVEDK